jgi:hypothetical protein
VSAVFSDAFALPAVVRLPRWLRCSGLVPRWFGYVSAVFSEAFALPAMVSAAALAALFRVYCWCLGGWSFGRFVVVFVGFFVALLMYVVIYAVRFLASVYLYRYCRASCHCERCFHRSPRVVHHQYMRLPCFPQSMRRNLR